MLVSLCPTPGPAPVKSSLREIFDNPAYPVPAAVRKRAEFFLSLVKTRLQNYLIGVGVQPSAVVPKGSMGSGTGSLCPGIGTVPSNRRNMMNKTCPRENGEWGEVSTCEMTIIISCCPFRFLSSLVFNRADKIRKSCNFLCFC